MRAVTLRCTEEVLVEAISSDGETSFRLDGRVSMDDLV